MAFNELNYSIKCLYDDFFADMHIDSKTGIVEGTNKRFSGYPYIGSNYVKAPVKILFIPLDTGKDECYEQNTFHSLESRESLFSPEIKFDEIQAHMAGLYATSLFILKESLGLSDAWNQLWSKREYKSAKAIKLSADYLPRDLMTYVAYENRFRFVTIKRGVEIKERGGDEDRRWLNPSRESQMLWDEIQVFAPDVIVFQGTTGLWNCRIPELKKTYTVVEAYHPSYYGGGADKLQYIVDEIGAQLRNQGISI